VTRLTVYRTDPRDLEPGEEVASAGDHREDLPNEETIAAEDAVRAGRTDGAGIRSDSLYVYPSTELADKDWTFRSKGKRHLYKLEIDDSDIVHVGDLLMYYQVIADLRAHREPSGTVEKYWTATPSERSAEYLVRTATVVEQVKNASEWKSPMQRAVDKHRDDPSNLAFYESVFKDPSQKE
jgi:hypothetical protein